ncbi:hypothetical protein EOT10_25375 [Streptomyces antnestii]|uniref:Secreted protein n=1 Tax=Streptomyces antnestii TaxID=2494256 RepID=A0A3S2YX18_9ACTN|nr:hypothetical protein EOT10_25375 [Streptomyces sp. San01]
MRTGVAAAVVLLRAGAAAAPAAAVAAAAPAAAAPAPALAGPAVAAARREPGQCEYDHCRQCRELQPASQHPSTPPKMW